MKRTVLAKPLAALGPRSIKLDGAGEGRKTAVLSAMRTPDDWGHLERVVARIFYNRIGRSKQLIASRECGVVRPSYPATNTLDTCHSPSASATQLEQNGLARHVVERAVIVSQHREGRITGNPEIWPPDGSHCKADDHAND